jgi:hypothetical protein
MNKPISKRIVDFYQSHRRFFILGAIFVASSALIYFIHYHIFQDPHHIFIYMVGDLAFLPLEVFLVVVVIESILSRREKQARMEKLNMVVGTFFSEVGNYLLDNLLLFCENRGEICYHLNVTQHWTSSDFKKAKESASVIEFSLKEIDMGLGKLKSFLIRKRSFLLRLLDNPNILEHESFTTLLWAVFHLDEELEARQSLKDLPQSDLEHLANDIRRVYEQLAVQWLAYLEHLKSEYPFLYSLILRIHPFQEHPSPLVV